MTTEEMIQEHTKPLLMELEYADDAEREVSTNDAATIDAQVEKPRSKKEEIITLYRDGVTDVADIVRQTGVRPSYAAQVLQTAGLIKGYFDLYTTTGQEQNVYTRFFRNVLQFRNVEAARESVEKIDRLFNYFERLGDRAGQHQAMVMALTGKNRARWSGKAEEANIFNEWLMNH